MIKNYIKIAWRNLLKNKAFSFINIIGLALGLATSTIILLWVHFEFNYENFHENKGRIYQMYNQVTEKGETNSWNVTPQSMGLALQKDYPEVEKMTRTDWVQSFLYNVGDKNIKGKTLVADATFLEIFSFPLIKGNIKTCLNSANNILITNKFAQKFFNSQDPIGKSIKFDNQTVFTVAGVLKDLPANTQFDFECIVPWSFKVAKNWESLHWGNNSTTTWIMLKNGVDAVKFSQKVKTLRKNYDKETASWETIAYPFERLQLYGSFKNGIEIGGRIELIRTFLVVALLILFIACINFMNLSTARSEKRAKEVGVRKVSGASQFSLVKLFYVESVLTTALAGVLAVVLILIFLPQFNQVIEKNISIDWTNLRFVGLALALILATGLVSGSYPALFLSSFKPVQVLKGYKMNITSAITPRKLLVVLQFTAAIVLICCTLVIKNQLDFSKNRQLGYSKDNLVYLEMEGDISKNYDLIKKELIDNGVAEAVSKNFSPITELWSNTGGMEWQGKAPDDHRNIDRFSADDKPVQTFGLTLVAGRDFDLAKFPTDSSGVIINEAVAKMMGFKNPIGQTLKDGGWTFQVVGVVKDFIMGSPYKPVGGLTIGGPKMNFFNTIHIRYNRAKPMRENLIIAEGIFKKYNPNYPFQYHFVDKEYEAKFQDESRLAKVSSLFSFLAILISCLGLFGLVSFTAEARTKEIGIRKVIGASVANITFLLSKDFLKLILIANGLAFPIAYYFLSTWLEKYEYRTEMSWPIFALAGVMAILIALLTVGYQSIKAALMNPVKSLKTE
jgi:putative ABC transport system permease protein